VAFSYRYPNSCTGVYDCARLLKQLADGAMTAAGRTPSEVIKRAGTASTHNYARLKAYLLVHAFDAQGNVLVHLSCMQATFGVSNHFSTTLHAAAVAHAKAKTQTISKKKVCLHKP
jgi:hypothetical protein